MLVPGADVGFIVLLVATACLGSWPNFFRAFPYGLRPELPFFDFTWIGWVVALALALMFGNTGFTIPDFIDNMASLKSYPILIILALLAGTCLAVGNMLYLQGMNVTGQTTAAPVSYGISLIVGLGLIYSFKSIPGRAALSLEYLFPGLFLIGASVCLAAAAQVLKINHQREKARRNPISENSLNNSDVEHQNQFELASHQSDNLSTHQTHQSVNQTHQSDNSSTHQTNPSDLPVALQNGQDDRIPVLHPSPSLEAIMHSTSTTDLAFVPKNYYPEDDEPANAAAELIMRVLPGSKAQRSQIYAFFVCSIGGAVLGGWRVFSNLALQPGILTPYSANFLFFSGAALGFLLAGPLLMLRPFTGRRGRLADYKNFMGRAQHWQAIVSGFLFTFGVCLMFLAEVGTGYAVAFIFSQSSTLLVSLWGIVYWKEFEDTPKTSKICLLWMFITYFLGLLVILLSHFPVLSLV